MSRFAGSFGDRVEIAVPPFHGLEPALALEYDSSRGNGFAGVGWALTGIDYLQRPHLTSYTNPTLGGDEIVKCTGTSLAPSCNYLQVPNPTESPIDPGTFETPEEIATPGRRLEIGPGDSGDAPTVATWDLFYSTLHESFIRIRRSGSITEDSWRVWDRDGTERVYGGVNHLFADYGSDFRWLLASKTDRHGNTVTYTWSCETQAGFNGDQIKADCYPTEVRYSNVTISILREARPDTILFATGQPVHGTCTSCGNLQTMLGKTTKRLKYVVVKVLDGNKDKIYRAYVISYRPINFDDLPATRRSIVSSITEYGTDTVLRADGTPNVIDATSFPPRTFTYTGATQPSLLTPTSTQNVNGTYCSAAGVPLLSGDFDGDRCADLFDRAEGPPYLPRVYLSNCDGTYRTASSQSLSFWNLDASRWRFGDFNGDGRTDLAILTSVGATEPLRIYLSNGRDAITGNFAGFTYVAGFNHFIYGGTNQYLRQADLARYQNGDFDGDGLTDFAVTQGTCTPNPTCTTTLPIQIQLARVSGGTLTWVAANGPNHTVGYGYNGDPLYSIRRVKTGDFNGDGRTDIGVIEGENTEAGGIARPAVPMSIYQSSLKPSGSGFTGSFLTFASRGPQIPYRRTPFITPPGNIQDDQRIRLGDFNGDGVTDIAVVHGRSAPFESLNAPITVHLSHGADGFFAQPINGPNIFVYDNEYAFFDPGWVPLGDYNGDGRTDIGFNTGVGSNPKVYLSEGYSSPTLNLTRYIDAPLGYRFDCGLTADVNGDGKDDLIDTVPRPARVYLSSGSPPDLLTTVVNGQGGKMTVTYRPSSRWKSDDGPPLQQTVDSTTIEDGRGGSARTDFQYDGGRYDRSQRRFLGFRTVTAALPLTASDNGVRPYLRSWFVQDYRATTSLLEKEQLFRSDPDQGGALLHEEKNDYQLGGLGAAGGDCDADQTDDTAPFIALATGTTVTDFDGSGAACDDPWPVGVSCGSGRRVRTERDFDVLTTSTCAADGRRVLRVGFGNQTREKHYGDWDITEGPETTSDWVYPTTPNGLYYVVDKPVRTVVTSGVTGSGAILEQENFYYDGTAYGDGSSGWDVAPLKGDLTAHARWINRPVAKFVVERNEYDTFGNKTREYDALGNFTTYGYDATFHIILTSRVNMLNHSWTWGTIDRVCGIAKTMTDPNGGVTTTTPDALCRTSRIDYPGGRFESFTYAFSATNPELQYVRAESPGPNATNLFVQRHVDGLGREWKARRSGPTTSQEIIATTGFDARGNVETTTDARYANEPEQTTTRRYDAWGRLTRGTHPDASFVSVSYVDANSESVRTRTDEEGHAVSDSFDGFGLMKSHSEPRLGGSSITTLYGNFPQQTVIFDAMFTQYVSIRDSLGRVVEERHPDRGIWRYEYRDNGPLFRVTDAMSPGQITEFTYDSILRKTSKTTRKGVAGLEKTVTWSYDQGRTGFFNVGRLTGTVDTAGTETYDYDLPGRLAKKVRSIGGLSYPFQFAYDTGDRLLWRSFPDGDALGAAGNPIRYDDAGRVTTLPGIVAGATWTAWGSPESWSNLNTTATDRTFDHRRQWLMTSHVEKPGEEVCQTFAPRRNMCYVDTGCPEDPICYPTIAVCCTQNPPTVVQNLGYQRDHEGRITSVGSPVYLENWSYEYTPNHWLKSAHSLFSSQYDQSLTYDDQANITTNSLKPGTYLYRSSSPLGGFRPHAVSSVGTETYLYDSNGNQTSRPGQEIVWNGENLPERVGPSGTYVGALDFTYDADGRLLRKERWLTTTSKEVTFYVENDYEVVGSETTKYFRLGDVLVAKRKGAQTYWLHTDALGTLQSVTSGAGSVVWSQNYTPEGDKIPLGYLHTETRGFTGERENEAGLLQLGARSYDPALAGFISPDPTIPDDRVVSLNAYAYAGNDPINRIDPTGFSDQETAQKKPLDEEREHEAAAADNTRVERMQPSNSSGDPILTPGQAVSVVTNGVKQVAGGTLKAFIQGMSLGNKIATAAGGVANAVEAAQGPPGGRGAAVGEAIGRTVGQIVGGTEGAATGAAVGAPAGFTAGEVIQPFGGGFPGAAAGAVGGAVAGGYAGGRIGGAAGGYVGAQVGDAIAAGVSSAYENTKSTMINAAMAVPAIRNAFINLTHSDQPRDPRQR